MNRVKKRKMDENYENFSREDLLSRIRDLENYVQNLSNSKSPVLSVSCNKNDYPPKRTIDFSKYRRRHIALKFLYLGWNYDGYVVQDNTTNTIEDHLFKALMKGRLIEDRASSNYHRCGRTDRGVSSFCQVISITVRSRLNDYFSEDGELPYCKILNGLLPEDIRVLAWSPVPDDFSARFSCKKRTYRYWFPRGDLSIQAMNEAVQKLIGLHDFRNFCKMDVGNGVTNFRREIFHAKIELSCESSIPENSAHDMYQLIIEGSGFLWHQIRCIVSILFLIGQGKEDVAIMEKLLDVETYPRKPQYALASSLPLNLYSCEFDDVNWINDEENINKVVKTLQSCWTSEAIKKCMLESILKDCSLQTSRAPTNLISTLFNDNNSRNYKPLFNRPVAQSLEDRVSHYMKRGKLKSNPATNDESQER